MPCFGSLQIYMISCCQFMYVREEDMILHFRGFFFNISFQLIYKDAISCFLYGVRPCFSFSSSVKFVLG